ncbi:7-deoxyloganetin glucosyltransferase-like [Olea europaea subsp. europaea]|uniref:7-deoxyloganetin glucosyltransferase-like n=1 Tax=Olea europaea subsp. europaea TaxID=158383 RepID=A0A8S0TGQ6_OLEEU|nr:7-deoxyloganetin glucosyltransferase-like [Olea europaea subsp. europaea]
MGCLDWVYQRENDSVLYINFGSITPLSADQMVEFAWEVSNSNQYFLWIIRPDMMNSKGTILPEGFLETTKGRGIFVEWCSQEQVLAHKAIGGFLTHCGWNSTIESISKGIPMICWPLSAEQQTNCRYACTKWDIRVEIEGDVTREKVEKVVRVMKDGENGREMRIRHWTGKTRLNWLLSLIALLTTTWKS